MNNTIDVTPRDYATLKETLNNSNPVDIAETLEEMDDQQAIKLFRMLPKDIAAEVFAYLISETQQNIVNAIKDYEISHIIDELFIDDAVDFIEEMPAGVVKRVLSNIPKEKRDIINHFLKYPEGSAGSIMTIEYIDLKENWTVSEAFDRIRRDGVDKETIYTCYVIDAERRLLGAISVRTLLLSSLSDKIGDIMDFHAERRGIPLRQHLRFVTSQVSGYKILPDKVLFLNHVTINDNYPHRSVQGAQQSVQVRCDMPACAARAEHDYLDRLIKSKLHKASPSESRLKSSSASFLCDARQCTFSVHVSGNEDSIRSNTSAGSIS